MTWRAARRRPPSSSGRSTPPPICSHRPPVSIVVEVGGTVVFDCEAEGSPLPEVQWSVSPGEMHARYIRLTNGSLQLIAAQIEDEGHVICQAYNELGEDLAKADLSVKVSGMWASWGPWTSCSVSCGPGQQTRRRLCNAPAPRHGGAPCPGDEAHTRPCRPAVRPARRQLVPVGSLGRVQRDVWFRRKIEDEVLLGPRPPLWWSSLHAMECRREEPCSLRDCPGLLLPPCLLVLGVRRVGEWTAWSDCSTTCGQGLRQRTRLCDSPPPAAGGAHCQGDGLEVTPCSNPPCLLDGNWGTWAAWSVCSVSCGGGVRRRERACDDPPPSNGGRYCPGSDTLEDYCNLDMCPVNDNLPPSLTLPPSPSLKRLPPLLPNPRPPPPQPPPPSPSQPHLPPLPQTTFQTLPTPTPTLPNPPPPLHSPTVPPPSPETTLPLAPPSTPTPHPSPSRNDFLPPPPHLPLPPPPPNDLLPQPPSLPLPPWLPRWSSWSSWGSCTATCGGGQRRRFRTCDNPGPSQGGRACTGPDTDSEACNTVKCPVNGAWSSWSEWSPCSMTCGLGMRVRSRLCNNPYPGFGGAPCVGEERETSSCEGDTCEVLPTLAKGTVIGELNGEDLGIVSLVSNVSTLGMQRTVTTRVSPLIPKHATWLTPLLAVASPVYWTSAYEVNGAANGHSLTKGFFRREAHVAFATGARGLYKLRETVDMTHVVRGVDANGALLVDVQLTGHVPYLPPGSLITLQPYNEDYVQTGGGSVFATSTRTFTLDGYHLPYAWNQTISYDAELGLQPYLVQTLHAAGLGSAYRTSQAELDVVVSASISPASNSGTCPSGFTLDSSGPYCRDNDECLASTSRCSHGCTNTVGSYSCDCNSGYTLGPDGYTCQDVDECSMAGVCGPLENCANTPGSYTCTYNCRPGLKRTASGTSCEDINECTETPGVCDQTCLNLIGGYRCDCRRGFRLVGQSRCVDIDECSQFRSPCTHGCENTVGSFRCSCPEGHMLLPNGRCKDINECATYQHDCLEEQECRNTEGSYICITHCPNGLTNADNGTCKDIDECAEQISGCHFTQTCSNTWGSYHCTCPRGFSSSGPGQPCL
ncbi:putative hemicentin-1 isoform X7, partial [Penaeus vannamei]